MKNFTIIFLLLVFTGLPAQKLKFQHGASVSLFFGKDLKWLVSYNPNLSYPIGNKNNAFIPMLDLKLGFYNNNLGSSVIKPFRSDFHLLIALSPTVSASFHEAREDNPGYIPIFTNTLPGFANTDYDWNFGLSVTYVWQFYFGAVTHKPISQRVSGVFGSYRYGFANYYNDGGPILKIFGDKEDRYWTGGGSAGFKNGETYIMLSYDKYTGFNKDAFQASDLLYIDNVNYYDADEVIYNSGRYSLKFLFPSINFGGTVNAWGFPYDIQDIIHKILSNSPYHSKLQKTYFDLEIIGLYEN